MKYKVDVLVITERSDMAFPEMADSKGFEWEHMYNADCPPIPDDLKGKVVLAQKCLPLELAAAAYRVVNIEPDGSLKVFRHTVEYTHWDNTLCDYCKTFTGEEQDYGCTYSRYHECSVCEQNVFG